MKESRPPLTDDQMSATLKELRDCGNDLESKLKIYCNLIGINQDTATSVAVVHKAHNHYLLCCHPDKIPREDKTVTTEYTQTMEEVPAIEYKPLW